jgi:hypothetical protein
LYYVKPTGLSLFYTPVGRLQAPSIPSVLSRDLDKDASIAADIQQRPAIRRTGQFLQRPQMTLERQNPSLALLDIQRILNRLIRFDNILVIWTRVGIH